MYELIFLICAAVVYVIGCFLTYSEKQDQWWYLPAGILLSAVAGVIWFVAVKVFDDKQRMYVFNLWWDALMMAIYYGLPLLIFDVKLTKWMMIGMLFIVIGAVLIKLDH